MRRKWNLSLQTWGLVILAAIGATPVLAWILGMAVGFEPEPLVRSSAGQWVVATVRNLGDGSSLRQANQLIRLRSAEWSSPAFQAELSAVLEEGGLAAALVDDQGVILFQYGPLETAPTGDMVGGYATPGFVGWIRGPDGAPVGTYVLNRRSDQFALWRVISASVALTLATGLAVWGIGRSLTEPIVALTSAAKKVNSGDLEFEIPASKVRELNELSMAFTAMRDGLRASILQQAEMEHQRRQFIAAVTHDLRTPLSSIRGYLEGLRDGVARTPEKMERYIAITLEKTTSLEQMIESLFTYATTEYLDLVPKWEVLEMEALLRTTVDATRSQAQSRGISLVTNGSPGQTLIRGDALMMTRVIDNLLANAIRYTPAGGSVTVGWRSEAEEFEFWVHDNGPGIPAQDLGRIFQPLFRGDKARNSRTGGAGLGLAIAKRLVEAHGGSITVVNAGGALFSVTLPLAGLQRPAEPVG